MDRIRKLYRMSHFAKVINGIVQEVIVIEQEELNRGLWGDPKDWIQTSYNTHGNVHYGLDGQPDNKPPLRGNYAGIGFVYDAINDVFYEKQPYNSWTLNKSTWLWEPPIPYPVNQGAFIWNEELLNWEPVPEK